MAKFIEFTDAHTHNPVLVNPDHVRTAAEVEVEDYKMVRLVIGGGSHQHVEGDLTSVRAKLTSS
jgi:hypothetical protein